MNKFFCKLLHRRHWNPDEKIIRVKVEGMVLEQTIGRHYWKCSKCDVRRERIFGGSDEQVS